MPVHLRAVCKFTGTWSPHMHHTAVSLPSCLGTRRGEETRQNPKSLSTILFFVHDLWKSLLIQAMIIPASLIINMGDFTTPHTFLPLSPPGWRGIVVTVRAGGRAGGCQTCGTHISVTAWWIFSIRSSVELSRPVGVHCHGHMPICPIWACPWAKNLSNLPQIGSRLCGMHISETAGWIYPI